jgi:hypothetical protein
MKPIVPAALAGLTLAATAAVAAAGLGASAAAASSSTPPCIPKVSTTKGHEEVAYCGPATATLTISGKTYSFKDGYCGVDPSAKIELQMTLGTILQSGSSPVNGSDPLFEMTVINTSAVKIATVNADYGGKKLDNVGIVSVSGSIPSKGTFKATGFTTPAGFTGSWNCHGVVYSHG